MSALFSYVFASGRLTRQPTRTRVISPPHRGKSQRTQTTTHVEHQAHPSITPKASAKNAPPGFLFLDGKFQSNVAWEGRFQSQASSMNEKKLSNIKTEVPMLLRASVCRNRTWVEMNVELERFSTQTCKDIIIAEYKTYMV